MPRKPTPKPRTTTPKPKKKKKKKNPPPQPPAGWPFLDPPDLAVISLRRIMISGDRPILLVTHDEDGSWQFLDGDDVTEADACTIALETAIAHDPTLVQTAPLPRGWYASRAHPTAPWWVAPNGVTIEEAYNL